MRLLLLFRRDSIFIFIISTFNGLNSICLRKVIDVLYLILLVVYES